MIIYGWQQLEGIKENVLRLVASDTRRDRRIISPKIRDYANGKRLTRVEKSQIYNCPSRKVQRLFNCIPGWIRNLKKENCSVDKFKRHLDDWLKTVPDQPRGGGYSERVAAESNSIQHQAGSLRNRRWPQGVAPLSWANNISLWDSESTKETKKQRKANIQWISHWWEKTPFERSESVFFPEMGNPLDICLWLAKRAPRKCAQPNTLPKVSKYKGVLCFPKKTVFIFKLFKKKICNRQLPQMVLPSVMIRPLVTQDARHLNLVPSQPRTNNCNNPTPRGGMGGLSMDFPYR